MCETIYPKKLVTKKSDPFPSLPSKANDRGSPPTLVTLSLLLYFYLLRSFPESVEKVLGRRAQEI